MFFNITNPAAIKKSVRFVKPPVFRFVSIVRIVPRADKVCFLM